MQNRSPWIHQLRPDRASTCLFEDIETDVAIVGAGIAGVATAFFALKYTDKRVTLLESYKLAHGATGHNAGQVTSYFERGFASLMDEFGAELAAEGQRSVEGAWELLDEMYTDAGLTIPFSRFEGHAGLSTYDQVLFHLRNNHARGLSGLPTERFRISENAPFLGRISEDYRTLFTVVPHEEILGLLETRDERFLAMISYQKGCVNSALFCEEVVLHLERTYPKRFSFFEHTPVVKVVLHDDLALLDAETHTVTAAHVILCTNGFDSIHVFTADGLAIDTNLHHNIHGVVGYMSGYLEKLNKLPGAWSYILPPNEDDEYYKSDPDTGDPYYLITRRPYVYEGAEDRNLISVAGPEVALKDRHTYSRDTDYPDAITEEIDRFVKENYKLDPNKKIDYLFTWHGLMGYTKNLVRLVGPDPRNPLLLYNLGCNGVGILPSAF
ncbi:MAG TPA: FAD-binding oxidoreductase, partial [Candidatus Paceibacterota bacterium]|nr:FAD-binding oxidoreductase [Candidatus Paceibacterota bacterium]